VPKPASTAQPSTCVRIPADVSFLVPADPEAVLELAVAVSLAVLEDPVLPTVSEPLLSEQTPLTVDNEFESLIAAGVDPHSFACASQTTLLSRSNTAAFSHVSRPLYKPVLYEPRMWATNHRQTA
jgi:hypothetical protein